MPGAEATKANLMVTLPSRSTSSVSWVDSKQAYKPDRTLQELALRSEREALYVLIRSGVLQYPARGLMNPS